MFPTTKTHLGHGLILLKLLLNPVSKAGQMKKSAELLLKISKSYVQIEVVFFHFI